MIAQKFVISLGAICLGVLCWNFDAFALSYPGDPGTGCRLSKCGGFNGCVRKDEFGPYRTARNECNRIYNDEKKSCEGKKNRPGDPLDEEYYTCVREASDAWHACGSERYKEHKRRVKDTCCHTYDPCSCPGMEPSYPWCRSYGRYCSHSH